MLTFLGSSALLVVRRLEGWIIGNGLLALDDEFNTLPGLFLLLFSIDVVLNSFGGNFISVRS